MKLIEIQRERWRKLLPSQEILDVSIPENLDDWELIEYFGNDNPGIKFVIIHRFELFGNTPKTLKRISEIACLNSGIEQIRLYEAKAYRYLRHPKALYLYPLIRNEKLFKGVTGYRNIREMFLYNHFAYEEYKKMLD